MNLVDKILYESKLLTEEKIISFKNPNYGNFVVLMGSPGAGKTFVVKNILNLRGFKHLTGDNWIEAIANSDDSIDLKNPEQTNQLNSRIDKPFKLHRKTFLQNQIDKEKPENVVIDITGKSVDSVRSALDMVANSNYKTTLVYVVTSKDEAIRRNAKRARVVPINFLMSVYEEIQHTYTKVIQMFDVVWLKYNDEIWQPFKGHENFIEIDGKKHLISRTGDYTRETNQIIRVK